ncbi:flagellar basal-body rod protein FlgB [Ketogulonicigenium robustum]|uniref:Flagellar basal-body rod protein FlgB n=1 Tax=Ketogulonicigenium robustum TaxID=92947 RepID=A0A1W6P1U2_9RHOB|nr:FlgB family protein [Ketogulonicigenium robustum]ARO15404.1 flagellar basal-body rod protein FlgB [Ketogulonicigenium robustum]
MQKGLDLFRTASAMAVHASQRINQTAINIANADTPGYRVQSVASFADSYQAAGNTALLQTRSGHLQGQALPALGAHAALAEESPNGNSVSLETEAVAAIDAQREHTQALTIYRHGLTLLRTSIGG